MSQKSKKQKLRLHQVPVPMVELGTPPSFLEFERLGSRHEELRYRLAPDCKVHIQFNGVATQDAISKLIKYLELGISDFPKDTGNSSTHD